MGQKGPGRPTRGDRPPPSRETASLKGLPFKLPPLPAPTQRISSRSVHLRTKGDETDGNIMSFPGLDLNVLLDGAPRCWFCGEIVAPGGVAAPVSLTFVSTVASEVSVLFCCDRSAPPGADGAADLKTDAKSAVKCC
ncbi:Protein of unknown function [Gryllus bimaculatus]|nr:Protein of unknown function [Gryllus bimaculatus]